MLSDVDADGQVALANLTTHGRQPACGDGCTVVRPGEHPYPIRDSCVYYRGAMLNPIAPLEAAKRRGELRQREPFGPALLRRVRDGALASPLTSPRVKAAIEAALRGDAADRERRRSRTPCPTTDA